MKTTSVSSIVPYLSIRVLLLAICLSSVLLALYVFQADYRLLDTAFRSYFPNLHEHPDTARLGITPLRLFLLVITFGVIAFVSGLTFLYFPQRAQPWREKINSWAESQKAAVRSLLKEIEAMPAWQKYAAGGILLSALTINLYRSSWSSYDGDEVRSYVYFVHNGWLTTLCHYPDTNNHVFFNLLCIPLDALFSRPAWVMRTVSIIAHLTLLSAIFLFVKRYFGFRPAFVAMSMGAFWLPTSFYASIGRGHELMSLFALIGIFHMYAYTLRFQSRYLVVFVVVSVLAFYTVPTYIHCFMSVCAFGLYEGIRQGHQCCVRRIIKAGLFTALGTVMLYWPIVLFSGIESLLANQWVTYEAARFQDIFIISVVETIHYVLGTPAKGYYLVAVLTVAFAYALVKTSQSKPAPSRNAMHFDSNVARWLRFMVISVIVTALIIVLHRVYPPYRVWAYFSFLCQITLAILLVFYLKAFAGKLRPRTQSVLWLLACAIQPGIGLAQYHWKERQPESIETEQAYGQREWAISYLMSRQPSVVLAENTEAGIDYFLRFRCIVEQQTVRIDVLERADWQSRYQFVICHPESFPKQLARTDFRPLFQVRQTVVYERKEAK